MAREEYVLGWTVVVPFSVGSWNKWKWALLPTDPFHSWPAARAVTHSDLSLAYTDLEVYTCNVELFIGSMALLEAVWRVKGPLAELS